MPYKFKGKKTCTQSDGSKGKYQTVKKDGSKRCYKSKKQYDASMAWAHEADDKSVEQTDKVIALLEEIKLRNFIRYILDLEGRS